MSKRNDQGREIWFYRILWGYLPAHWKGVAYPAAIIGVVVPLCMVADKSAPALSVVPLIGGWAITMWLCARHSSSRPKDR